MKTNIFLPCFSGFYDSVHSYNIDGSIDCYIDNRKEEGLEYDFDAFEKEFDIDYKKVYKEYSKSYFELYKDLVWVQLEKETGIKILNFIGVYSPEYYNYSTDEIKVSINYKKNKILEYLNNNKEEFSKYISSRNDSYSGYISYSPNTYEKYIEKIGADLSENILSQVIEFFILQNYKEEIEETEVEFHIENFLN